MPIISVVVLSILFGSTLLIFILAIAKSIKSKKQPSIEQNPTVVKKEPITEATDNDDEIAAIVAAVEAYRGDSSGFRVRRITNQKNGSLIWNRAGVNQNNSSFL